MLRYYVFNTYTMYHMCNYNELIINNTIKLYREIIFKLYLIMNNLIRKMRYNTG